MATEKELMDLFGEIEVNKKLRDVHSKNLESRQPSLFDYASEKATEKANMEGMKKAALENLNQKEAQKEAQEKARAKAAENKEYADKRVKASPLIAEAELAKMKEMSANMGKKGSGGSSGGGGGLDIEGKTSTKFNKPKLAKGGTVRSSASKRADGIAQRGKTRGRMR